MEWAKKAALAVAGTMLFPVFVSDEGVGFSNSIFSILLVCLILLLLKYTEKQTYSIRMKKISWIPGTLFSAMTAFGYALENTGEIPFGNVFYIASVVLYAYFFSLLLRVLWSWLEKIDFSLTEKRFGCKIYEKSAIAIDALFSRPIFPVLVILLLWLPCFISSFPGNFKYDATREYNQVVEGYNGNFPMLHSVLIIGTISFAHKLTGSYNAGIAVYTVAQMVLLAAMFGHILWDLYKQRVNKILLGAVVLYAAAFPAIHLLVTCTVRDVLFSGLITYTMFLFYQFARDKVDFLKSPGRPIALGVVFALTLLSRNNNAGLVMLAIVAAVCVAVWLFAGKENRKGAKFFCASSVLSYVLVFAVLFCICQPYSRSSTTGSLSLATQPLARAYFMENEKWTEEDKETFRTYFDVDNLVYIPENADSTKGMLDLSAENFLGFVPFWIKMGLKCPESYLEAVLANTRQMWFPGCVVDGYQEYGIPSYDTYDKCYFNFTDEINTPGTHMGLLPGVREFYTDISMMISFEKVPILSMLFSIGFQFWLLINCCAYIAYRRCRWAYLPLAILLGYAVMSSFVPLVLLRYFAGLFFAFPLVLCFTMQPSALGSSLREE